MNEQEWLEWLNLSEELKKIQNIKDLAINEEKELKNLEEEEDIQIIGREYE